MKQLYIALVFVLLASSMDRAPEADRMGKGLTTAVKMMLINQGSASVPALPETLVSDTFTGANGTSNEGRTPDTDNSGWGWGEINGTWQIQSNALKATAGSGNLITVIQTEQADVDISVEVTAPAASSCIAAVILRFQNSNNYWRVQNRTADSGVNTVQISEITGGTVTLRASGAATMNAGTTYTLRVVSSGNTITAFWDGDQKASYGSATSHNSRMVHGVYTFIGSGYVSASFDNLTITGDVRTSSAVEWHHDGDYIGEHPIIDDGLLFMTKYHPTDTSKSGLAIYDPADGTLLQDINVADTGLDNAPVVDVNGKIHLWSITGKLYRLNRYGKVLESISGFNTMAWERVGYDSVNNRILAAASGDLKAYDASSYTTPAIWAATGVTYTNNTQISPPLVHGDFVYVLDNSAVLHKLNLADGTTVDSLDLSAQSINVYFPIMYDTDHDYVYAGDDDGRTVYAVDVSTSTLSVVWSKQLGESGDEIKRSGSYHNNVLYMTVSRTSQSTPDFLRSKIYALDVTNSGNILWTNTTAYDNNAHASGVLVDDDYAYADTHDFTASGTYHGIIVIDLDDGSLVKFFPSVHDISSGIPVARNGYLIFGIWTNELGSQSIRIREGGGTDDFPWKADDDYSGYVGPFMSGNVIGV